MIDDTFIIAGAWFIGAFVNGLTGMGGALLSLPLISLFISSKSVILVSLIAGLQVGLMTLLLYWRYIDIKEVLGFWAAALPGIFLGVWLLKIVDIEILELLLCVLIVTHIVVQLVQDWLGSCMAPRAVMKYLCGFLAGIFGASLGINGPIMAIYTSLMCMEKNKARGFFNQRHPYLHHQPGDRCRKRSPDRRNSGDGGFRSSRGSTGVSVRLAFCPPYSSGNIPYGPAYPPRVRRRFPVLQDYALLFQLLTAAAWHSDACGTESFSPAHDRIYRG